MNKKRFIWRQEAAAFGRNISPMVRDLFCIGSSRLRPAVCFGERNIFFFFGCDGEKECAAALIAWHLLANKRWKSLNELFEYTAQQHSAVQHFSWQNVAALLMKSAARCHSLERFHLVKRSTAELWARLVFCNTMSASKSHF